MAIYYRINILASLKEQGMNTNTIYKEKLLTNPILQAFREDRIVKAENLSKVCELLKCRIDELLVFIPEGVELPKRTTLFGLRADNKYFSSPICHIYYFLQSEDITFGDNFEYVVLKDFYSYLQNHNIDLDGKEKGYIIKTINEYFLNKHKNDKKFYKWSESDILDYFDDQIDVLCFNIYFLTQTFENKISSYLSEFFYTVDNYYKEIQ